MQNKGALIILTITLVLVTIYELSFTAVTYKVKRSAREYAQGDLKKETSYVDSIALLPKETWSFLGYTYKECQKKEINLGLDLKGGMNVILEVSVDDILRALSNYNTDKTFTQALSIAKDRRVTTQGDFIDIFQKAYEELDPNAKLASVFGTVDLKGKINFNSTNADVIKVLKTESDVAINNAFNVLSTRIDRFGVVQPNITKGQTKGRILIELPGVKDPQRVRELLQGTANLEFWETYENGEVIGSLSQANNLLKEIQANTEKSNAALTATNAAAKSTVSDTTKKDQSLLDLIAKDTTKVAEEATSREAFTLQNPLFGILNPRVNQQGQPLPTSMVGLTLAKDTAKVNRYLKMNQVKSLFPRDLKFAWSQNTYKYDPSKTLYELHALKITTRDGRPPLDGKVVTSARPSSGTASANIKVDMSMNPEGAKTWARITRENIGRTVIVLLDGYVRSAATVQGEINGGNTEITGNFSLEEAQDLSNILMSGKMPAPAHIISDNVVGPTLGKEAIQSGFTSFAIAFLIVLLYMIFYYSKSAGSIADLALFTNIFFLFGVLASLGAVLTLPGIAGIVLTTGMAVDANVLIYERIREELRAGKVEKMAITDGYKHAFSAIIDSHVTSILTGIVLYTFGTGPIRGFATTLVIGNLLSLFTAFFLTRIMFEWLLKRKAKLEFSIPMTEHILKNTKIDFIGMRKIFYGVSLTVTLIGIISLSTRGLNPGIDFAGGRTYVVKFDQNVRTEDIASSLNVVFKDLPMVVTYGGNNQVKITTKYKINETGVEREVDSLLYTGLKPYLGGITKEKFLTDNRRSSETVGPTIATDTKIKAAWAVGIALIMMFLYIFLRFRTWQHGFGAVVALFHDTLIVISIYSLGYGFLPFSMDIDQSFIAAILTVIGYSVMDTVIVFDRLREYIPLYRKRERAEVLNMALNSTLSRTINTSMTVILVLLSIFLFGGAVIRGFVFAMLVGVIVGTYSSVFVATSLVYDTTHKEGLKG
jgi:SecD/SecF fusion protein